MTAGRLFTAWLCYGVLSLWIEERWAWSLFQVGLFAMAGYQVARPRPLQLHRALIPLGIAAAWPLIQIAAGTTISRWPTWDAAMNWFAFLVVFALAGEIFAAGPARRAFIGTVSIFGMVLAALSVLQSYSSGGKVFWLFASGFDSEVFGPFVNRNQFAAWVELLLPAALYLAATEHRLRPLYGAAAATLFGAVVASRSRAGFVLACVEILAVAVFLLSRFAGERKTLALAAARFGLLAVLAASVAGWQGLRHRLEAGGSEAVRVDAVRASIEMAGARPWAGSGLGTWSRVYPRYSRLDTGVFVNQAHNDWVQWAAEGGLPFVACLVVFAALLWKPAVRSIYGLGTVAFLLHALVDYPMQQRPALAAWFFAMAGAVMAAGKTRSRER